MKDDNIEINKIAFDLMIRAADKKATMRLLHLATCSLDREASELLNGFVEILFEHDLTGSQVIGIVKDVVELITNNEGDDDKHE